MVLYKIFFFIVGLKPMMATTTTFLFTFMLKIYTVLKGKRKNWLVWNLDNVSQWRALQTVVSVS
jgi:hypothetical protein